MEPQSIGRLVFGIYGDAAPDTCANFERLIRAGSYDGTTFHKVFSSKFAKAGQQGSHRYGQVDTNKVKSIGLQSNKDIVRSIHLIDGDSTSCFASHRANCSCYK
jgi:cyclophilin family peptidyl-prolyl cis-trans isomerase